MSALTPVGEFVGKKFVEPVHNDDGHQLDEGAGDGHNDVANAGASVDARHDGVDGTRHGQTVEQHREHNGDHNSQLHGCRVRGTKYKV